MPLPKPKDNEKRNEFVNRCMIDITMIDEYEDRNQRFAICNTQYTTNKKQKNEKSNTN